MGWDRDYGGFNIANFPEAPPPTISRLDWFVGMAMQGILAANVRVDGIGVEGLAKASLNVAKATIEAIDG